MDTVTLAYAKEHLEELVARAAAGEDVRITGAAVGTVRLNREVAVMPNEPPFPPRNPGLWRGKISIPDEMMFEPLSEQELAWLSGETSP